MIGRHDRESVVRFARAYRVPPWLIDHRVYPMPRRPRLAWILLRIRWWMNVRRFAR